MFLQQRISDTVYYALPYADQCITRCRKTLRHDKPINKKSRIEAIAKFKFSRIDHCYLKTSKSIRSQIY